MTSIKDYVPTPQQIEGVKRADKEKELLCEVVLAKWKEKKRKVKK